MIRCPSHYEWVPEEGAEAAVLECDLERGHEQPVSDEHDFSPHVARLPDGGTVAWHAPEDFDGAA